MPSVVRAFCCAGALGAVLMASASAAGAAGALAVGSCAAYGYAFDYEDAEQARSAALSKCTGRNCKVVATTRRGCVGFAIDAGKVCGPQGWASAARLGRAQNNALRECYKFGGRDCVIRAWACDSKG